MINTLHKRLPNVFKNCSDFCFINDLLNQEVCLFLRFLKIKKHLSESLVKRTKLYYIFINIFTKSRNISLHFLQCMVVYKMYV